MALPVTSTSYSFQINQRISFVSLNDTSARFMFGVKVKLKANGYTVKGSCDRSDNRGGHTADVFHEFCGGLEEPGDFAGPARRVTGNGTLA